MASVETRTRDELLEAAHEAASYADAKLEAADDETAAFTLELRALRLTILAATVSPNEGGKHEEPFEGWADVELMGHRTRVGHVREIRLAGKHFLEIRGLRLESRDSDLLEELEIYAGNAIYSLTPVDEAQARQIAINRDQPF